MWRALAVVATLGLTVGSALSRAEALALDGGYDSGLYVKSSDRRWGVKLNGRMQLDYNYAALEGEMQESNAEVRRVWMTMSAYAGDWVWLSRFDIDQSDNSVPLSMYMQYRGFGDQAWLSFGRHKEPFGMSWSTSIRFIPLPERAAVSDRFTFARSVGVQLSGKAGVFGYHLGLFEDDEDKKLDDDEDGLADTPLVQENGAATLALTGRVFARAIDDGRQILHLGGSFSKRRSQDAGALELAYIRGPLALQYETMRSDPSLGESIAGQYLEAAYFLSDDVMPYKNGVMGWVKPNSVKGALQLVFRVDRGDGDYSDIELGKVDGRNYTAGVNWFASDHARVSASYSWGEANNVDPAADQGEEFRARLQYIF